jgi:hypothetical protein
VDAVLGLLVLAGLPALGYWRGYRRGVQRCRLAPLTCPCGGAWGFHDPATGKCTHVPDCPCVPFVDQTDPTS